MEPALPFFIWSLARCSPDLNPLMCAEANFATICLRPARSLFADGPCPPTRDLHAWPDALYGAHGEQNLRVKVSLAGSLTSLCTLYQGQRIY